MQRKSQCKSEASVSQCLLFQPLCGRKHQWKLWKIYAKLCGDFCCNDFQTADRKTRTKIQNRRNVQFFTDSAQLWTGIFGSFRSHESAVFDSA